MNIIILTFVFLFRLILGQNGNFPINLQYAVKDEMNSITFVNSEGSTSWTAGGNSRALNIKGKAGDTIMFEVKNTAATCSIALVLTIGQATIRASDSKSGWSSESSSADFLDVSENLTINSVSTQAYGLIGVSPGTYTFKYVIPYGLYCSQYDTTDIISPDSISGFKNYIINTNKGRNTVFQFKNIISSTPGKIAKFKYNPGLLFGKLQQGTTEYIVDEKYPLPIDKVAMLIAEDYGFEFVNFSASEDDINWISCQITINSCFEACKACQYPSAPTITNQQCLSCFDGSAYIASQGKCTCAEPVDNYCYGTCIPSVSTPIVNHNFNDCIEEFDKDIIYLDTNFKTFEGLNFRANLLYSPNDEGNSLLKDFKHCFTLLRNSNGLTSSDRIMAGLFSINHNPINRIKLRTYDAFGGPIDNSECTYLLGFFISDIQTTLDNSNANFMFIKDELPHLMHLNDRTFHRYLTTEFATAPFESNMTKIDLSPCEARLRADNSLGPTDPIILYVTDMISTPPNAKYQVFTDDGRDITPAFCFNDCIPVSTNTITKDYTTCIADLNNEILYLKGNKAAFTGSDFTAKILKSPSDDSNNFLDDYRQCINLLRTANSLLAADEIIVAIYIINQGKVIPEIAYHAFNNLGIAISHSTTCNYFLKYFTREVETVLGNQVTNFMFIKDELPNLMHLNDRTFHRYLTTEFATAPFESNMTKIDLSPCEARLRADNSLGPTDPIILYVTDMISTPPSSGPIPEGSYKVFTETGTDITPSGGCFSNCIPVGIIPIPEDYTTCIAELNQAILYLKANKPTFTGLDFTANILISPADDSNILLNDYRQCINLLRTANTMSASDEIIIAMYNLDRLQVIPEIAYHAFNNLGIAIPHSTTCNYFLKYLTEDVQGVLNNQIPHFNFIQSELLNLMHLNDRTFHRYISNADVSSLILPNMTYINITKCESKLLQENNLPVNTQFILHVTNLFQVPPNPPPEATYLIFTSTGQSLNSAICSIPDVPPPREEGIIIFPIPMENVTQEQLDEAKDFSDAGINIFDPADPFFTDICTLNPLDTDSDIPRKDRIKQFLQNNASLCPSDCVLNDVNYNSSQVSCKCPRPPDKNANLTFEGLKDNLISAILDANFDIVLCYKLVINLSILSKNIGSWVMMVIGALIIINMIYSFIASLKPLEHYLNSLHRIEIRKNIDQMKVPTLPFMDNKMLNHENNIQIPMESPLTQGKTQQIYIQKSWRNPRKSRASITKNNTQSNLQENNNYNNDNFDKTTQIEKSLKIQKRYSNFIGMRGNQANTNNIVVHSSIQNKTESKSKLVSKNVITEEDYDEMSFDDMIEQDKRNILQMYWGFLRVLHPIIYTFFIKSIKVLKSIKISKFLLGLMLDLALSAFFYSDDYISHNYNNEDSNNFFYNLPISIYSYLGATGINILLNFLSDSESSINKIEKIEDADEILIQIGKFFKCYKIRLIIYNIFQVLLLLFLWYYATAFCSVYQNSQDEWLINCGISIGISMCIPFVVAIAFSIMRVICIKCKCNCLYKILSFLTWIF